MNDDKLLRARAEDAESELEEERRYCGRCYDLHRHTLTALQAKLAEVERERDEALAALARARENHALAAELSGSDLRAAEQDAARLAEHIGDWIDNGDVGPVTLDRMRAALAAHEERVKGLAP